MYNYSHSYIDQVMIEVITKEDKILRLPLIKAIYNDSYDVKNLIIHSDDKYAEMFKWDRIRVIFKLIVDIDDVQRIVIIIEGHNPIKY